MLTSLIPPYLLGVLVFFVWLHLCALAFPRSLGQFCILHGTVRVPHAAATAAAERAEAAAEERGEGASTSAPPELDEFGRDAGLMRRQEGARRAQRRRTRVAARKAALQRAQVGYGCAQVGGEGKGEGYMVMHARACLLAHMRAHIQRESAQ